MLKKTLQIVYNTLSRLSDKNMNHTCQISYCMLARKSNCSESTVKRAVSFFIDTGLIKRYKEKKTTRNIFVLYPNKAKSFFVD